MEEAVRTLNNNYYDHPRGFRTIYRLGSIFLVHGEYGEALNCIAAVEIETYNPHYWEMKAEM